MRANIPMKIPTKTISDAAEGSLFQLRTLARWLNYDNYSSEILQAPLTLLLDRDPSTSQKAYSVEWATLQVEGLELLCNALSIADELDDDDPNRMASITAIRERLSSLTQSVRVCTECGPLIYSGDKLEAFFCTVASLAHCCISLDETLADELLSSQGYAESFLMLWSYPRSDRPGHLYHGWGRGTEVCVIQETLSLLITVPMGYKRLCDTLFRSEEGLRKFVSAMATRIELLSTRNFGHLHSNVHIDHIKSGYNDITQTIDTLIVNPIIHTALNESRYLGSFVVVLQGLDDALRSNDTLPLALDLLRRATAPNCNPIQGLHVLFDFGIFPVIAKALAYSSAGQRVSIEQIYCRLGAYSCHPRILYELRRELSNLDLKIFGAISRRSSQLVGSRWRGLLKVVENMSSTLKSHAKTKTSRICDNDMEHGNEPWIAKACSRCHLVVYCSMACQKEDWDQRHHEECSVMKATYQRRHRQKVVYKQETRRFHIGIVEAALQRMGRELEAQTRFNGAPMPHNSSLVILDARSCSDDSMQVIRKLPLSLHMEARILSDCPMMEARSLALISRLKETTQPGIRMLVEMEIGWNATRGIALLVEAIRNSDDEWVPVSSVVRVEQVSSS